MGLNLNFIALKLKKLT